MREHEPDLATLLESWTIHLRAERKSKSTLRLYRTGVRAYLGWCQQSGLPPVLDREQVTGFTAHLLDGQGREAETARAYQMAVRRFSAWLHAEGELPDGDPLLGLRPPKLDAKVVPVLSTQQLQALLRACQGRSFNDRRDEAIIRVLIDTGVRASGLLALETDDVDLAAGIVTIRRGKGGKGRRVPISPQTARALDRYLRARARHALAASTALWLARGSRRLAYSGLYKLIQQRAEAAGIKGLHPHVFRHTFATRWLARGGSEGGVMSIAGWSKREMLDRYVQATRQELAAAEHRGLGLADDLG
jgi:integrase/recombinase XerD